MQLIRQGFSKTQIDAVDASREMLDIAKEKDIYERLICDYIGEHQLPIEDG